MDAPIYEVKIETPALDWARKMTEKRTVSPEEIAALLINKHWNTEENYELYRGICDSIQAERAWPTEDEIEDATLVFYAAEDEESFDFNLCRQQRAAFRFAINWLKSYVEGKR